MIHGFVNRSSVLDGEQLRLMKPSPGCATLELKEEAANDNQSSDSVFGDRH